MKKEVMTKWVKALRSGKFKQSKGTLKNDDGYCCLGVLCEISEINQFNKNRSNNSYYYIDKDDILPSKVQKYAKMISGNGRIYKGETLAALNDRGKTFSQIADIIEKNYKDL